jgi:hypothetical protein
MRSKSRRKYLLSLSSLGLIGLAGCQNDPSTDPINEDTEDDPIPLPSSLQRNSIPSSVFDTHLETIQNEEFARVVVTEDTENGVRREYQRTDIRQYTEVTLGESVIREIYRTRERQYTATYQGEVPRYSQQSTQQLLPIEDWGEQTQIRELITGLNEVELLGINPETEEYLYEGKTSPVIESPDVEVAITVNPLQITSIEVSGARDDVVPRRYLIESGDGSIREPSWISEAEQFSRSVTVGKRREALFIYNDGSQAIQEGSTVTIIHPNGHVYTYQFDEALLPEEIIYLEILQSGSVIGLKGDPPQSEIKLVIREEPYYFIGFGPNGEQLFDKSTRTSTQ